MGAIRRNVLTRSDARVVAAVAAVSAVVAALADVEPTGTAAVDALLAAGWAALVTWLGATAPWWALAAGSAIVTAGSVGAPPWVWLIGVVALAVSAWIGAIHGNLPAVRAGVAAAVVQVSLRLDWDPFFLASAGIAALACLLVAITGLRRRQGYVRRRVLWGMAAAGVVAVISTAGFGVAALRAREPAVKGYRSMLDGLEFVQEADVASASAALRDAAASLDTAADRLDGVVAQGARLIPVVAPNRTVGVEVLADAAGAASAAADALDQVDIDQLTVIDGTIDTVALELLQQPLADLADAVTSLDATITDARTSPWLLAPLRTRLDATAERSGQAGHQSRALAAFAEHGPAMLGADGDRRYLVAFVNPAEARGHSGLMGNWSEVTASNGRLEVTESGRTAALQQGLDDNQPFSLDMSDEFFDRYEMIGAGGPDTPVDRSLWSNITSPPHMPTVGETMVQLYEASTGRTIDGAFVLDPRSIAALLAVSGPIEVDGLDEPLTADNVERFLVVDQYEFAESEREDFLEQVTERAVTQLLTGTLPPPQEMVRTIGPPALEGHLSAYATREDEQRVFRLAGIDASLPDPRADGAFHDGLAVITDNASGNKIDSFLHRSIDYRADVDRSTGAISSEVNVTLRNDAPTEGLPDYVIGNLAERPTGTNRTMLTILTPLDIVEVTVDGEPIPIRELPEQGWTSARVFADVPPGDSVDVRATMTGRVDPGEYQLVYRPQPLPNPDELVIEVTDGDDVIVSSDVPIERRGVITSDGVTAWR
jgi:hypothetical protein